MNIKPILAMPLLFFSITSKAATLDCRYTGIEDGPDYTIVYDEGRELVTRFGSGVCIEGRNCQSGVTDLIKQSRNFKFPLGKFWVQEKGIMVSLENFKGVNKKCITGELMMISPDKRASFYDLECVNSKLSFDECWPEPEDTAK